MSKKQVDFDAPVSSDQIALMTKHMCYFRSILDKTKKYNLESKYLERDGRWLYILDDCNGTYYSFIHYNRTGYWDPLVPDKVTYFAERGWKGGLEDLSYYNARDILKDMEIVTKRIIGKILLAQEKEARKLLAESIYKDALKLQPKSFLDIQVLAQQVIPESNDQVPIVTDSVA